MLSLRPLDERVPIEQQLNEATKPAILVNIFTVAPADVDQLLTAWEHDANWMKGQPGYISTQLHRGIGASCVFLNYAVWEISRAFPPGFHPSRIPKRVGSISSERRCFTAFVCEDQRSQSLHELDV